MRCGLSRSAIVAAMAGLDGDGWIRCDLGHLHWGRFGAAGLLSYARDEGGQTHVLLQRRSWWSSHGGTWGLFGGARQRDESATAAALREAAEECTLPADMLRIRAAVRDDHGRWAYDTLVAELPRLLRVDPLSMETAAAAWVPSGAVEQLELHPGLAVFWAMLHDALTPLVIIVDGANVMGSRPDGWWRDRAGAAARLRDELAGLAARGVRSLPDGVAAPPLDVWFPEIILVVEGAARSVADRAAGPAVPVRAGSDARSGPCGQRVGSALRAVRAAPLRAVRAAPLRAVRAAPLRAVRAAPLRAVRAAPLRAVRAAPLMRAIRAGQARRGPRPSPVRCRW